MSAPSTAPLSELLATITQRVEACPVCGSKQARPVGGQQPNRYLEEFAVLLGVDEDALADEFTQLRCDACGLIYKNRWFDAEVYRRAFVESVPVHPRGWDCVSHKFTPERFRTEVEGLAAAVRQREAREIAKQRRTIQSYLDNLPESALPDAEARRALAEARSLDLDSLDAGGERLLRDRIAPTIVRPKAFSRFSGYGNEHVQAFVRDRLPQVHRYAEVGCPLWGLFPHFAGRPDVATTLLRDEEDVFWGERCVGEGRRVNCWDFARRRFGVELSSLGAERRRGSHFDLLAVIHYLDHLRKPLDFLRAVGEVADHVLLAAHRNTADSSGAIQHFTVFELGAVEHLAGVLGWRVLGECPCPEDADDLDLVVLLETRASRPGS